MVQSATIKGEPVSQAAAALLQLLCYRVPRCRWVLVRACTDWVGGTATPENRLNFALFTLLSLNPVKAANRVSSVPGADSSSIPTYHPNSPRGVIVCINPATSCSISLLSCTYELCTLTLVTENDIGL